MAVAGEMLSVREFARRDGCSHTLVQKALKSGHLVAEHGRLSADLVGSPWRATARGRAVDNAAGEPSRAPAVARVAALRPPKLAAPADDDPDATIAELDNFVRQVLAGEFPTRAEAERVKESALAAIRVVEAKHKAGASVDLAVAERVFFNAAREIRDAWTSWVPRIAVEAAAELGVEPRALTGVLTKYVQQHLEELGEPEFDIKDAAEPD
ncbi:hypothetical protein [Falsiroseomonas tokyonensis]|uniref:Uncharacterized protein n=1 Tax=Falsiroseomonas tokyonensis TaxID=430521 RepID=A0ABV7C2F3_9PROT|nr:hypothetical protein [Falsiroseomonas tokyonensis]MBU8540826.1 hypothetical protein [Falsiroseomonas tokyonensis]